MKYTKIAVFGDSIAWGAFDPSGGGWVARLRRYIGTAKGQASRYTEVYNFSVSGETTFCLLKRFKVEYSSTGPRTVIFAIGVNDSTDQAIPQSPRVSPEQFLKNLAKLLALIDRKLTKEIIFVGLFKVWGNRPELQRYNNINIELYNGLLQRFCKQHKLKFLDLAGLLTAADLVEGLHPNSQGHRKIFNRVKAFLESYKII